jgi:hypothetical protein
MKNAISIKLLKTTAFIALAILLSACASGPQFKEPTPPGAGKSAIYIYRPWTYANGAASPVIQLDGVGEEKLVNGSYIRVEALPGKHRISIAERFDLMISRTWPGAGIDFSTEPDQQYYIRYSTAADIIPGGYFTIIQFEFAFQLVPEAVALAELKKERK